MPSRNLQRFRLNFSYNAGGVLRTKEREIEARTIGHAYEILKQQYGKIVVNRWERIA